MDLWEEALDVDDSDLHHRPLLRHCRNQTNPITTTTNIPQFQTLDLSPSSSQTVNSVLQTLNSSYQAEAPPQSRTIPGPAGIVQAAKLRKSHDNANCLGQEELLMATQEYIRKVVEDPKEDDDFKRNPWLSATKCIDADGGMLYCSSSASLGEINKCQEHGKLNQVVAVIKSCTPNELGDMTVTLKDPTGSVSGTIHHKVFTEGDFRKGICVGAVIILHKVSVFSPSRSTHYLNITKRNLIKVFYKDSGSSHIQSLHKTIDTVSHSALTNSTNLLSQDSGRVTPTLDNVFSLEQGSEGITNRLKRRNTNNEQENINYSQTSNNGTNMKIARNKEIFKEASDVIEKDKNVGHLSEDNINGFSGCWTDEQILELSQLNDL